jgi:quaternary ammonium compound-resistance protein SugE
MMAWLYLVLAGLLEIGWAIGLKYTEGFSRRLPNVGTLGAMLASFALLGLALRALSLGTAYALWPGIGTAGTVVLGIMFFGELVEPLRLGCIALIGAGVAGLKILSPH